MSVQAGPAPGDAAPPPGLRTCPRCRTALAPGQEWCLNCGSAATTRIAAAPTWRGPLAAMLGVGLLALAALALAFFALADDDPSPPPVATPAATAPAPAATPSPAGGTPAPAAGTPTPTPAPGEATPAPTATPAPAGTGEPAAWPEGREAWTIVMHTTADQSAAVRRAQRLTAEGVVVGVLATDDFRSLPPARYIVFSGQYESSREAARAQRALGSAAPASAFVRRIEPR